MTERILEEFEQAISDVTIVPSSGGVFEVTLGHELVYSKKQTGRHAEHDEVLKKLRTLLS